MNRKFIIYLIGLLYILSAPPSAANESQSIQEGISTEILRLHVIANSDLESDQNLKLQVKDEVLDLLRYDLKDAEDIEQAKEIIRKNLDIIEKTAVNVMNSHGYSYDAKATIGWNDFPIKQYGDMIFPAGTYQALRIELGAAKGKNWWCVMFPSLCYVDETYDVITNENKEKFKKILTEEEYESLLNSKEIPIFYKSKIKELIISLFESKI